MKLRMLLLGALLTFCAAFTPKSAHAQTTVTGMTLTGPTTIPCPGQATYTFTVNGTYTPNADGQPNDPGNFVVTAWDNDGPLVGDDKLAQTPSFLFPSAATLLPGNNWSFSGQFNLFCQEPECEVSGVDGSSHETTAEVYVNIIAFDDPLSRELQRSNEIQVTCQPVPESSGGAVFILGALGLVSLTRRRRGIV